MTNEWRQVRITSEDFQTKQQDDCYLDPNDPAHELMELQYLGGLGSQQRLLEYRKKVEEMRPGGINISKTAAENARIMKEKNIKPGTPEWFQLWFSLPYFTGESKT